MTAKITNNIELLLAKALFDSLKKSTNDETFYAVAAFSKDSDYNNYSLSFDSESEFSGGADSEFGMDDQSFYSQNSLTFHRVLPGGVTRCVPRVDWLQNRIYNAFPSKDNFYVLVREFVSGIGREALQVAEQEARRAAAIKEAEDRRAAVEAERQAAIEAARKQPELHR